MQLSDDLGLTFSPLSYGQKALWFLYQMAPESVAYNIFITVRITSELNIPTFYRTAQKIFERHPILRTTYTTDSGKPVQLIHEQQELPIQVIDASSWSEDYLREQIFAETDRPFNLENGPVLRVKLLTRSAQAHILLVTMHHIICDMWSVDLLLNELQVLYTLETAEVSQKEAEIAEDSLPETKPYTEFVRWQSEMLSSAKGEELWDYWQNQLAGELPILNLPTDRLRPNVQTYRGATHSVQLDEQLIPGLRGLALTSGTSLYGILLATFYVLLYRYTLQEDILVGTPMLGRWGRKFKATVGYFVNLVVLRASVSGNLTFKELLSQISRQVKEAQKHQDYPFPLLVERLQRDASRCPLCQVSFTWQKHRWCELVKNSSHIHKQGLEMEPYLLGNQRGAIFDLDVMVMEASGILQVYWQYNSDLFDSTTIERMARHFQTLLEGIVANPEQRVSELPLLTESERHQLLVEWNNTFADYPQDKCIHQLFEAQVEQNPDAVAVVFEDQQLTYRELNYRANKLAHYLQALGVKPEVLVGICVERSLEMVVGILGILKAGGAYVPLDPVYPGERLAFMLEDSAVPVLLTQQRLVESLPQYSSRVLCLDRDWGVIAQHSPENPTSGVTSDNQAYVMYTSGSTGKPKGVSVIHRGVVRLVKQTNYANLSAEEVFLQLAPISFDASTFEIWGSLLNGARLVVMPPDTPSLQKLGQALKQYQITTLWLTAGLFHLMVEEQLEDLKNLHQLLAGGDVLSVPHVKKVLQELEGCRLINGYGPTENTTFTCCHSITEPSLLGNTVSIGRPIANTQVYLLDDHKQPVPVGVPGELYIGGDGLARGYLNRPDLTAEKFSPNPFSHEPGSRLYKTGDKARYLPGGNIEFLGRIDNQVKIRGFRIELGEIEALLSQHPGIRETVVTVRENVTGDKQLVAYIVPHQEPAPTTSDLRRFLKEQLPDYMVPSAFVTLESLPLTPNGKVDRRALPEPELRPELELTFVAPRTPIEEMLANIWAGVLGIDQVGVHDNFFELGGHSLLATQILTRVRATLAVELPLHSLFEAPTVASLAQQVEITLHSGQSIQVPPLLPIPRSGNIPLSFAQARLWFLDQLQPNSAFYNIPIALRLWGQLNVAALESGLNEIIRRHEVLRANFTKVSGQPVAVIASTRELKLLLVDLQNLSKRKREVEAQRLVTTEAERPFNLEREPLIRATLLQLDETEYIFLLTVHHIIFDGWSTGVFYGELAALYEAFCTGKPKVLPELPIQYADFSVWKRRWLTPEVLETQLNYWKQQLKDAPTLLELPTSRPRKAVQTFRGAHQSFTLSLELSKALATYSKRTGVTLFIMLYAAFVTWLYRYTGSDDIVVGTPIANRNRREIEGLIGFFVNTLVLRTDLSGNPSFEQLLYRVREVAIGAYAHQDLPFEQLVEALQPERSLSYTPLFQVMFALDDASMPSIELFDLTVSSYPVETGTAKFDLTLSMENTASGLIGEWEYNTDLFDIDTIARMAGHFQNLLEGIVANPIQPISQLPLLTERERHQLLVEWNNTTKDYPQDKCIHQLFEEQVERSPSSIAIVFEEEQLTYQALNARANQLAHYLLSLGVGAEVLVGICVERSLEMVVGILGILKAGGAYVPLDPNYPTERLAYILSDSGVSVLLTQQRFVDRLPKQEAQVVCLDTQWEIIAQHGEENIACGVNAENLAYVIYTSGSTGKPKGVTIQHRSLVNYTTAVSIEYEIEKSDCILQFSSISFDVSAEEIYTTLTSGATLVLRTDSMLDSVEVFLQKCRDWEITVLALPTAYWHELAIFLSQEKMALPPSLRLVIIGGEKALIERVKTWFEYVGQRVRLVNNYGPTEATVGTTICELSATNPASTEVPIGRPIRNVQTYVLDRYLQPVPIGIPGELYIGGAGLARGYLNRPDLTAQNFIKNPFSDNPQSRLYKTGDKVRYLSDGNIEFLDRIDNQVKIRGFRIELGEIEAVLGQHPLVREAAVIAREDVPGDKRLVAYVVPQSDATPISTLARSDSDQNNHAKPFTQQLKDYLKTQLPDYMVPSAFVILDTLPLTPNSKGDRRALPKPEFRPELQLSFVAPRTPIEEMLASIWAEVLGVQQVGIHDNFFELGGHSLLATSVISRIQEALKIELQVHHLFEAPTITSLSQVIETARQAGFLEQSSSDKILDALPPLVPAVRDTHIPLSRAQEYIWYLQQLNPNSCLCNSGVPLRFNGSLSPEVVEKSINEIIRRHEILRTTFTIKEGQPVQVIAPSLTLPLKIVDLQDLPLAEREASVQRLVAEELQHHFDLANGPLIQVTLLRLAKEEHWLLIPMHHIITDGWSIGIFCQELETLISAFSVDLPNSKGTTALTPLPSVPFQYADFTLWERQYFNEEVLEKQLSYWLQKLADSPQPLNVLLSQPCPRTHSRQASFYSLVLPKTLVASIEALSRSQGVTPFDIMITALNILLFKWSGQTEILVEATTGNRSIPESERILGCFINDVILRSLLSNSQTALNLLEQVKETVNEAINHKEVPLHKVIEAVRSKRELTISASVTMEPSIQGLDGMSKWKVLPVPPKGELWDEKIPIELYIYSPTEDSQTIEISGYCRTDLFPNQSLEPLFSDYQEILQKLAESPETKLSEF